MSWKIPRQEIKCAYCPKKKIFKVTDIEAQNGLMFCSVKCRNRYNHCVDLAKNFMTYSAKSKGLTPRDLRIIKREKNMILLSFNIYIKKLKYVEYLKEQGRDEEADQYLKKTDFEF